MRLEIKRFFAATLTVLLASTSFAQDKSNLLLPPATYPPAKTSTTPPAGGQTANTAATAPAASQGSEQEIRDKTFEQALKTIYPLTPDQEVKARQQGDKIDKARGEPLVPVKPVTRSVRVSLRSGDAPPVIKVAPGWISTLTFADVTGQPWPVLNVTNGNSDAYDVLVSGPKGTSNIVTISSKQAYTPSNIAVSLVGAKVPVMMTLEPSPGSVDFRVDAQIDQRGPNASYDAVSTDSLPPTSDAMMLNFLDGVAPDAAVKLNTSDRDTQAWRFNDMLYVRTTKTLLSPAYVGKQSNVVGVNVYVLNEAPVMVMSGTGPTDGRLESVTIQR